MEKLTYDGIVRSWEAFLKESPKNYIRIENKDKGAFYMDTSKKNPSMFTLSDIESDNGSVGKWLDYIIKGENLKNAKVVFRKKSGGNGSVSHPKFNDTDYDFTSRLTALMNNVVSMENNTAVTENTQSVPSNQFGTAPTPPQVPNIAPTLPAEQAYHPQTQYPGLGAATMQHMGGLGQAALAAGMGLPELIEVKKKADRADEYKDQLMTLKDENHALVIKNRDLESKVSNAEQQKEIAVKLAQLENKSFLNSEAGQQILASLPAIAQSMMAGAGQQPQQQQAALGMPAGMSAEKQRFIGYIMDDMCTREMVQILEATLTRLATLPPQYKTDLQQLNLKEYGTAPSGNG